MVQMVKILLIASLFSFSLGFGATNSYEDYFGAMSVSHSNLIQQGLNSEDLDAVYSAIKRVGELRLTNMIKDVYEWLGQSNPVANIGKVQRSQQVKNIFNISIWTIGQIGSDRDAQELVTYLKDISQKETIRVVIFSLGELHPSVAGLNALNRLTAQITDESIAEILLAAIMKHNSKSSAAPLMEMSKNVTFSENFRNKLSKASKQLVETGI